MDHTHHKMEQGHGVNSMEAIKEVKTAKRTVETAVRLYGPANITSVLDRETYADKLAKIAEKLEIYFEKTDEVIEKLEALKSVETEEDIDKTLSEISEISDTLVDKVTKNEINVKKKIEQIIKNSSLENLSTQFKENVVNSSQSTLSTMSALSTLSQKISDYCEAGPFMTHLPQFVYSAKYVTRQYQKKLPEFG